MDAKLKFNEKKATQAAAYLLMKRGGSMSYMKLIKLLYLADREALMKLGRPITTDQYVSMDKGPVLSKILDLISDGDPPGQAPVWNETISPPSNYEIRLKSQFSRESADELSDAQLGILDNIFDNYGSMNRWDLLGVTHKLPEWQNPNGGAIPISYKDILSNSGKSEIEISAILDELDDLAQMNILLPEG